MRGQNSNYFLISSKICYHIMLSEITVMLWYVHYAGVSIPDGSRGLKRRVGGIGGKFYVWPVDKMHIACSGGVIGRGPATAPHSLGICTSWQTRAGDLVRLSRYNKHK